MVVIGYVGWFFGGGFYVYVGFVVDYWFYVGIMF